MQLLYPLFLLLALISAPAVQAQEGSAGEKAVPIHIEADRMESYDRQNEVIFLGRVEARQGGMLIQAEKMTVSYFPAKNGEQAPQRIEKVVAEGEVKLTKEDWVATGHALDYFAEERKAVLTGDAKVWQESNLVTGNRIVLFLDEGKTVVERSAGEGERVKAFIYPEQGSGAGDQEPGTSSPPR